MNCSAPEFVPTEAPLDRSKGLHQEEGFQGKLEKPIPATNADLFSMGDAMDAGVQTDSAPLCKEPVIPEPLPTKLHTLLLTLGDQMEDVQQAIANRHECLSRDLGGAVIALKNRLDALDQVCHLGQESISPQVFMAKCDQITSEVKVLTERENLSQLPQILLDLTQRLRPLDVPAGNCPRRRPDACLDAGTQTIDSFDISDGCDSCSASNICSVQDLVIGSNGTGKATRCQKKNKKKRKNRKK